jgi:glycosyltransferase involved in cell wall biosynthesis
MLSDSRAVVAFVQRRLPFYRVPLVERLRERLADAGVSLRFLHGEPAPDEAARRDSGELDWAEHLPTRYLAGSRVVWQPFMDRVAGCALVIVSQENKLVHNLGALLDPRRRAALAFFGHGRNLQSAAPQGALERFKQRTTAHADWWFPYTELSARLVEAAGFPRERITVVNNSIDTTGLRADVESARAGAATLAALGLPASGPVALFVGSLYEHKRIGVLLDAAALVHRERADFRLAIAGDGPERALVERALQRAPWADFVRWFGSATGQRKAALLARADLVINAGAVGLGVLDAFAAGLPQVAADSALHGPEIGYLEHEVNGLVVPGSATAIAAAVVRLLNDPRAAERLRQGALASAAKYSVEQMAERFCGGIVRCIAAGRRTR